MSHSLRSDVPAQRIHTCNQAPVRGDGDHVVYWMVAARRTSRNFALQRAVDHAVELGKPLLVLEALRCDYPWASDRLHRFVLDGMADNQARCAALGVTYLPYVEPESGAGRRLLDTVARDACVVVTDDFPILFLRRMVHAAGQRLRIRMEAVDSNGLLPIRIASTAYPSARSYRRFLQQNLPQHLETFPEEDPLSRLPAGAIPGLLEELKLHWPAADRRLLSGEPGVLARLPIDHSVEPTETRGGERAAREALRRFLDDRLARYGERRNDVDHEVGSGLSPYLHFGHISAHEVFLELARRQPWTPASLSPHAVGERTGWWGMDENAESFLEQAVTWRELGYNFAAVRDDYDRFESLPEWALKTLREHAADPRSPRYDTQTLEEARTQDPLWNAAQTQLLTEGRIHNYLRMLWGKKILEWTGSPEEALDVMIAFNDRYALDGRDPNSYSGIFWVLGRYDRPWAPVRPIFGSVRTMSSRRTARKMRIGRYLARYAPLEKPVLA